jgi:hypothetical protein
MTLQQREVLCAEVCQQAMRDWRAGKIGNQELIWITWRAQQRYGVGEVETCSNSLPMQSKSSNFSSPSLDAGLARMAGNTAASNAH